MNFRVTKQPSRFDSELAIAYGAVNEAISKKVELISVVSYSGDGDGSASSLYLGIIAAPGRWRVVGIGGFIGADGHDQIAEIGQWGYGTSDIGASDPDAFGQVTMDDDAGDAWNSGEIMYQGISPYEDFFGFDPLADSIDTWDIAGEGAGVLMGDWQTKAAVFTFTKANVANSDGKIMPFILIEYETGAGVC